MERRKFMLYTGMGIAGIALLEGSNEAIGRNMFPAQHTPPEVSLITLNPLDNGKALVNPNMGWTMHFYILEHEHYGSSVNRKAWSKNLLLKAVEDYHASYMSIHLWPRILLEENRDVIEKINLRMGYRLQLKTISWPEKIRLGEPFIINYAWMNAGVAPCYPGGFPCITLKDEKGGIVSVLNDESFNVDELHVSEPNNPISKQIVSTFTIAPTFNDPEKAWKILSADIKITDESVPAACLRSGKTAYRIGIEFTEPVQNGSITV